MKRLLAIFLSVISLTLMAQVPQGVGYQGVATDASGIELVNQAISIRASVLSGSATGTVEWEETHTTSTNTFGLFALTIGQGTNTTNGVQTSFADISWGTNTHFLKIEMDVTGGSNYSFMGTNQMMSVPYALYAENANINYDSISNMLSNDTTFITNVGGGMGGGDCDWRFPDGLDGELFSFITDIANSYSVPLGKNLYITNFYGDANSCYLAIDYNSSIVAQADIIKGESNFNNSLSHSSNGLSLPILIGEGETLKGGGSSVAQGILIDKNVTSFTRHLQIEGPFTVPIGKRLYILNSQSSDATDHMFIDEGFGPRILQKGYSNFSTSKSFIIPVLIDENMTISGNHTINGYLVDENYFAGCGGGSSSNNSNTNIVTREFTTTFDASSSSDTIYISQLTGDSINKLSIEIIDVSWSTINDQDVLLSINSNASNKTINSGQLEIRGDLNGNTVVQGYPRSSVSSGLKAMKKLIISGDNPFLIFEPYSYIGTGGSGTITIWIKAAF